MELKNCWTAIKKRYLLIVVVVVCAAATAWLSSSFLMKCVYESKSTIVVTWGNSRSASYKSSQQNILLPSNYIHLCDDLSRSITVAEDVINHTHLCIAADKFNEIVSVDADFETGILKITARTNSPELSKEVVEVFNESLNDHFSKFVGCGAIRIIDEPKLEQKPVSPNIVLNILLCGIGGLMAGILLAILPHGKECPSSRSSTICEIPGLSALGYLPIVNCRKPQESQFYCLTDPGYHLTMNQFCTKLLGEMERESVKTVLVTSPHPCEGSTTAAANIAVTMAQANKRVLLIDCNSQNASLYRLFCAYDSVTVSCPVEKGDRKDLSICHFTNTGVDLVAHVIEPQDLGHGACRLSLRSVVKVASPDYDIILLDYPALLLCRADVLPFTGLAAGVLVIADYARLDCSVLKNCMHVIKRLCAKALGMAVNRIPPSGIS